MNEDQHRKELFDIMNSASLLYDKNIFTLGTIILSSSFALMKLFYKNPDCICYLYITWIMFFIAITVSLFSLLYVQYLAVKSMSEVDLKSNHIPLTLQAISGVCFVLALLFLAFFIGVNS